MKNIFWILPLLFLAGCSGTSWTVLKKQVLSVENGETCIIACANKDTYAFITSYDYDQYHIGQSIQNCKVIAKEIEHSHDKTLYLILFEENIKGERSFRIMAVSKAEYDNFNEGDNFENKLDTSTRNQ